MGARERLAGAIDRERERLREAVPTDRAGAVLALVASIDRLPTGRWENAAPDLVTGRRDPDLGGNLALWLCLGSGDDGAAGTDPGNDLTAWAEAFLAACGEIAAAERVAFLAGAGAFRLADRADGGIDAWLATKQTPTSWRERADADWWGAWSARQTGPKADSLPPTLAPADGGSAASTADAERRAGVLVDAMGWQLPYPPQTVLGGMSVRTCRAVVRALIANVLWAKRGGRSPAPIAEGDLVVEVATTAGLAPDDAAAAVSAFTLDRENAAFHAAVPGIAAAPLVRIEADRLVASRRGLTTEPLLFLARELRQRDPSAWHATARTREAMFRADLYALFADKRFVTADRPVDLRRDAGDLRTDVDAAVFDRKTGALALFELKAQDPFARSAAELLRQRDSVLAANRQISGMLAWVQQHGPDALLARIDPASAKRFRVRKVFPFVLGRFLARFDDGPEPDRRAGWGTWPQVLRLRDGRPVGSDETNPLASLHAALAKEPTPLALPDNLPPRDLDVGGVPLRVHRSFASVRGGG